MTNQSSRRSRHRSDAALFDRTVQVAGIASYEEARMLLDCGVDYLGFPLCLPVHREDVTESEARGIIGRIGASRTVVITYLDSAFAVRTLLETLGATIVQLHGPIGTEELAALRQASPGLVIIKSMVIRPGETLDVEHRLRLDEHLVDAYITDTFDPATGAAGATGKTHDWMVSRRIAQATKRPVILAGGLRYDNVADAIHTVRPSAVDVHTGVEDALGCKSRRLTEQFVTAARAAFDAP